MRFTRLSPYALFEIVAQAKGDEIVLNNSTEWHGLVDDGKLIGCTGFMYYKNKIVFKNHFVFPQFRRQGYFKKIMDFSIQHAREKGYKVIEANANKNSIHEYLKRGAVVLKEGKLASKVQIILESTNENSNDA